MNILAIETSCDETSLAVLTLEKKPDGLHYKVRSHQTLSQAKLHSAYGGVFPNLAKREHGKALTPLFKIVLKEAKMYTELKKNKQEKDTKKIETILEREEELKKVLPEFLYSIKKPSIDVITVTIGPGLEPALWVGISFAKALGTLWDIPIVPVNHMEGHIISVITKGKKSFTVPELKLPAMALLISGGHTELVHVSKIGTYKIIGQTRDDAVGEAFDKVARMLELPYPGGPEISKLADESRKNNYLKKYTLPRPMLHTKDFDFSFSGLKTAVLYTLRDNPPKNKKEVAQLAEEFENAVTEVLTKKTLRAIKKYTSQTLIIGGGVSANTYLRGEFKKELQKEKTKIPLLLPSIDITGDNALMIGIIGGIKYIKDKKRTRVLKANGNLSF